jgi:hypothetical protein
MTPLTEYLEQVERIRSVWTRGKKPPRKGEEETLWFRGHRCADWRLIPKLYRMEYKGADENEIRQEFQSRALQLIQGRLPATKWEWYFLMQHYGAPTRLLDWTDNFLVALYFAVKEHPKNCDAAVWVLNPWWLNRRLRKGIEGPMLPDWQEADAYLPELEEAFGGQKVTAGPPAAIDPLHVDRRLAAQGSRFVIFGKTHDLMRTKAAQTGRPRDRHVARIIIPQGLVREIQRDLGSCGFTESFVFPDLDGLCREICHDWRLS